MVEATSIPTGGTKNRLSKRLKQRSHKACSPYATGDLLPTPNPHNIRFSPHKPAAKGTRAAHERHAGKMASFTKGKTGWRVYVKRKVAGKEIRRTNTFTTKSEAQAWAAQIEAELNTGRLGAMPGKTVGDLFVKYAAEVSPKNDGGDWEIKRLTAAGKMDIANVPLTELDGSHIAKWRDKRMEDVKTSTVRREWTLLSSVFTTAKNEWKWIPANPMTDVKRPPDSPHRDATWKPDQIDAMLIALGYTEGKPQTIGQLVACCFLFALETACRAGELRAITKEDVTGSVVRITGERKGAGKTVSAKRDVPLSVKAKEILKQVDYDFKLSASQLDSNFRKARDMAGINGVTFHDSRATAITMLAKKLDILDLARAIGHKNLSQLMVYYREDPQAIAARLD